MNPADTALSSARILLPDPVATTQLGQRLCDVLRPGDPVLLSGPIGAGKSHLARAVIRELMARAGAPPEDIPSPTYTLVQTYECGDAEVWHADLYRLSGPDEIVELGLDAAFDEAICLVEWPDRLGDLTPPQALHIALAAIEPGDGRQAILSWSAPRWRDAVAALCAGAEVAP